MNRVRDRERKWLLPKRLAGRIKRRLEYQAAATNVAGGHALSDGSAVARLRSRPGPCRLRSYILGRQTLHG